MIKRDLYFQINIANFKDKRNIRLYLTFVGTPSPDDAWRTFPEDT